MQRRLLIALVPACLALAGCAIAPLGAPVPSVENIARARAAGLPPLALGEFALAPGKDPALDQRIVIRTNAIHSPYGNSMAQYLKESLAADLRAAGLLAPTAIAVISGTLVDSQIDVPMSSGPASASVAAVFVVTRNGQRVYERELRARSTWAVPYIGVEAVPQSMGHYGLLYRQLVASLLDDPGFRVAVRP